MKLRVGDDDQIIRAFTKDMFSSQYLHNAEVKAGSRVVMLAKVKTNIRKIVRTIWDFDFFIGFLVG